MQAFRGGKRHLGQVGGLGLALVLAGCGGGGEADPPGAGPVNIAIFNRGFVQSFDVFQAAAQSLITQDPRYLLQKVDGWYLDFNANGRQDLPGEPSYNTYPLESAGVHYAHAAGLMGAGQVIGVIDDGFLTAHEAFAGKTVSVAGAPAVLDHGTMVASIAAGLSGTMVGVAPGADLVLGSFDSFQTLAAGTRLATQRGAIALNNSWGFINAPIGMASYNSVLGGPNGQDYLQALRDYAQNGVVIFASSNDETEVQSDLMAALPLLEPALEEGWIAAVNGDAVMQGDDVIAARRISAACLEAAAWCLAAEGTWGAATAQGAAQYDFSTGTSFAAPMIAGAMALLGEAFPDLTPHELRLRLLASADNVFTGFNATSTVALAPGFSRAISAEWGHGFLDVKAALLPIGIVTATMADGAVLDLSQPVLVEGQATGDAVTQALAGVTLAATDALRTGFGLPASVLVAARPQGGIAQTLRRDWGRGDGPDCCALGAYFPESAILGAGSGALRLGVMVPDEGAPGGGFGVMMGQTLETDLGRVAVTLALGQEDGALLPRGLSAGDSLLLAGEVALTAPLGAGIEMSLAGSYGGTLAARQTRLSATSLRLARDGLLGQGDRLTVSVGLPVAVSEGQTTLRLPVIVRGGGGSVYRDIPVDLAPQERERRLGLSYEYPVTDALDLNLSLAHVRNLGHVAGRHGTGVHLGLRLAF